ncbi:MAG: hypothetical protein QM754_15385 [Tepidisphaeraceae bacterium]
MEHAAFRRSFLWKVSKYREARGLPLTIPSFGRICASIVVRRKTMTAWQAVLLNGEAFDMLQEAKVLIGR